MTDVLGWPLDTAVETLKREGHSLRIEETSSRKGTEGTDCRVVRIQVQADGDVSLLYARFSTDIMN